MMTSSCPLSSRSPIVMLSVVKACNCAHVDQFSRPRRRMWRRSRPPGPTCRCHRDRPPPAASRRARESGPGRSVQIAPHPVAREVHDEVVAAITIQIRGHDRAHVERMQWQLRPRPVTMQHPQAKTREVDDHLLPAVTVEIGGGQVRGIGGVHFEPLAILPVKQPQPWPGKSNTPVSTSPSPSKSTPTIAVGLPEWSWNQPSSPSFFSQNPQADSWSKVDNHGVTALTAYGHDRFRGQRVQLAPAWCRDASRIRIVSRSPRPDSTETGRSFESCCSGVGDVQVAFRIRSDTLRAVESAPIRGSDTKRATPNRRHDAAGSNLPDRAGAGVGNVEASRRTISGDALGPANRAALPVPSAHPNRPAAPASVVTTPAGVIFRMVLLLASVTYTVPALSTAIPRGLVESRGTARPVGVAARPRQPRERRHDAAGCDFPDRVIAGIGDIERAGAVERNPRAH